ncbi:MAG: sulfurtransferase [Desulfobacteraceae bacterium]|nr:sulfurtransferase [Desulfobacteraceae bacterium]
MKKIIEILFKVMLSMSLICLSLGCQTTSDMQSDKIVRQYAHPEAIASTDWLQTHLKDKNIRIVDCIVPFINPNSYNKGHIPGAVSLDVIRQLSNPEGRVPLLILTRGQFESVMGKLGISNDTTVVVYDAFGGSWSARLWWALMYYGHTNVKILNGGLVRWKAEGKEIETKSFVPQPTIFKANTQTDLLSEIEDVKQAIKQYDLYLVDALNSDHHFGKKPFSPTLAPPGHIPTSINIPGPSNINMETGLLLSPVELKEHWSKLEANQQDKVITYCGAGYWGAFDLFALHQLGYERVSLYDGSWMEWISDPTRQIETE